MTPRKCHNLIMVLLKEPKQEIDAYVLGIDKAIKEFKGKCIAVIHRLNDDDDKLVVVPKNKKYSDEEIKKLTYFQEKFYQSVILR